MVLAQLTQCLLVELGLEIIMMMYQKMKTQKTLIFQYVNEISGVAQAGNLIACIVCRECE